MDGLRGRKGKGLGVRNDERSEGKARFAALLIAAERERRRVVAGVSWPSPSRPLAGLLCPWCKIAKPGVGIAEGEKKMIEAKEARANFFPRLAVFLLLHNFPVRRKCLGILDAAFALSPEGE